MVIEVAVSIINSDKLCCSYDDLYFGISFWDRVLAVFAFSPLTLLVGHW